MRKALICLLIFSGVFFAAYFGTGALDRENSFVYFPETRSASKNTPDFSILVLGKVGQGNGGKWHTAPLLADAIFLILYRSQAKQIDIVSIPRDLYGNFGGEIFKINEVLRRKKIDSLLAKLPEITGVETKKYAVLDLGAVKKFIDLLDGVDVELTSDVVDSVSGYRMKAGAQHLSGDDVVWIIRNRFASEGDFFREKNQHLIMASAIEKYRGLTESEKLKFLLRMATEIGSIETNISAGDILPFTEMKNGAKFESVVVDFKTGLVRSSTASVGSSTAYIILPSAGMDNYEKIKDYIRLKIYGEKSDSEND